MPDGQLARRVGRPEVGKRYICIRAKQTSDGGGVATGHVYGRQFQTQLQAVGLVVTADVASVDIFALAARLLAEDSNLR